MSYPIANNGVATAETPVSTIRSDPALFINRELSWLDFNDRVLEEARDPSNPLLERLRFAAICASNLDEFFEVRVAGLQAQLYDNLEPQDTPPDGMGPLAQLTEISRRAHDFVNRLYEALQSEIRPQLAKHGIRICNSEELTPEQNTYLDNYFNTEVYPVLTPLAIDPAHPFPHLHNKSLNLVLRDRGARTGPAPPTLRGTPGPVGPPATRPLARHRGRPASLRLSGKRDRTAPRCSLRRLPRRGSGGIPGHPQQRPHDPGDRGQEAACFRRSRRRSASASGARQSGSKSPIAPRMSSSPCFSRPPHSTSTTATSTGSPAPVDLTAMVALTRLEGFRDLKEPPFEPQMPAPFANRGNVFASIREQDILIHHPYESFGAVIQFIEQASEDPQVLAIKQTLYRTADENPIITALIRAAENGKQVTALVELQARLDEENNIVKARCTSEGRRARGLWHRRAQDALQGDARRPPRARRHPPLRPPGTGNYNPTTARLYTDLGFFTCRPEFGEDAERSVQPLDRLFAGRTTGTS